MADPEPDRRPRRLIRAAQLLLVVAAAALWVSSRLPWVVIRSFDGLGQPKTTSLSGADWSTALVPLALVSGAAAIAAVAVRGWPLRVLAVLVAAASLATGYLAISLWAVREVAVRAADLAQVPIWSLVGSERHYVGAAITLVAAVCTLVGAALLMRAAASARAETTKYATPATRRSAARGDQEPTAMSERVLWDALDEGRDPTDRATESTTPQDRPPGSDSDTEGR
jgi:uncharacterized membrane protein (TIGR02234 family)